MSTLRTPHEMSASRASPWLRTMSNALWKVKSTFCMQCRIAMWHAGLACSANRLGKCLPVQCEPKRACSISHACRYVVMCTRERIWSIVINQLLRVLLKHVAVQDLPNRMEDRGTPGSDTTAGSQTAAPHRFLLPESAFLQQCHPLQALLQN